MALSLEQWDQRYKQQAKWTHEIRSYLFNKAQVQNDQRLLEVGCGTGVILDEIQREFTSSIFGVDLVKDTLVYATSKIKGSRLVVGDGVILPFDSGVFECSICHFLLLWVTDPNRVVQEMVRVTHPGGSVIINAEPDYGGRIDFPNQLSKLGKWQIEALLGQGANPFIGRELRQIMSKSGLTNIEVGIMGGQWLPSDNPSDESIEWMVVNSDIESIAIDKQEIDELYQLDKTARESNYRILFVPTFYAIGQVAG